MGSALRIRLNETLWLLLLLLLLLHFLDSAIWLWYTQNGFSLNCFYLLNSVHYIEYLKMSAYVFIRRHSNSYFLVPIDGLCFTLSNHRYKKHSGGAAGKSVTLYHSWILPHTCNGLQLIDKNQGLNAFLHLILNSKWAVVVMKEGFRVHTESINAQFSISF